MFKIYYLPNTLKNDYFQSMITSFVNEFNRYPTMWVFVLFGLTSLTYAALKIKNEPNDYLKKSKVFEFKQFFLQIPSWWTLTINEKNLIRFERTDTKYDWYCEYWAIENSKGSGEEILQNLVKDLNLVFDEKNNLENFSIDLLKISRMEGMSTINGIDRAYFDIFVAEINGAFFVGKSHSSILNGCVEGPYFEEVLQRLKIKT